MQRSCADPREKQHTFVGGAICLQALIAQHIADCLLYIADGTISGSLCLLLALGSL
jgi:hypothetical protein